MKNTGTLRIQTFAARQSAPVEGGIFDCIVNLVFCTLRIAQFARHTHIFKRLTNFF